jgi:hypothetical protein
MHLGRALVPAGALLPREPSKAQFTATQAELQNGTLDSKSRVKSNQLTHCDEVATSGGEGGHAN